MNIKDIAIEELERQKASGADTEAMHDFIRNIYAYQAYEDFNDIPDKVKTKEGAYNWLFMKKHGKQVRDYFLQIPVELVLDKTREVAVAECVQVLSDIDPKDTQDYLRLCMMGYERNHLAATYFHEDFRTAKTVEAMIAAGMPQTFARSHAENSWMTRVMTPELVEKASMASLPFMMSLPDSQISDEALRGHLDEGYIGYSYLHDAGKLKLAARYLKTGAWPNYNMLLDETQLIEPRDIGHAFDIASAWDEWSNPIERSLYMAYVLSHPIGEVVPLLTDRKHIDVALELYTEAELWPYMKTNRHLKAAMLEGSLGL